MKQHSIILNQIGERPADKLLLSFPSPEQVMETAGFRMPPVLVSGEDGGHSLFLEVSDG